MPKAIVEGERPIRAQGTHTGIMTVPADADYDTVQGNHTHLDTGGHIRVPPTHTHPDTVTLPQAGCHHPPGRLPPTHPASGAAPAEDSP